MQELTKEAYNYTMQSKRKTLQHRDLGMCMLLQCCILGLCCCIVVYLLASESQHEEYDVSSLRSNLMDQERIRSFRTSDI